MSKQVYLKSIEAVYRGFFQVQRIRLTHDLFAGGQSQPLVRELLERGHAVAVLLYDPVQDAVVLVEQFRIGAIHDKKTPWLFELCAGMIETGEDVTDVAHRETEEETGCRILDLETIAEYYVTPGGCTERVTLLCAKVDAQQAGDICGVVAEGEDIKVHVVPAQDLLSDVFQHDSATVIIALQWLALHRARLKAQWG